MRLFVQVTQKNNDQERFNKKISAWEKHGYNVVIKKSVNALDCNDRITHTSLIALLICQPEPVEGQSSKS